MLWCTQLRRGGTRSAHLLSLGCYRAGQTRIQPHQAAGRVWHERGALYLMANRSMLLLSSVRLPMNGGVWSSVDSWRDLVLLHESMLGQIGRSLG